MTMVLTYVTNMLTGFRNSFSHLVRQFEGTHY
uniref:Uncharacterized protein n=1 Tax=Lepeophtheirus salmonis TaxID=72036 RepID=A0A0K2TR71_LEPSM